MSKLKPCPFCGFEKPYIEHYEAENRWDSDFWTILCRGEEMKEGEGCMAQTTNYCRKEEAIEAWNRRQND